MERYAELERIDWASDPLRVALARSREGRAVTPFGGGGDAWLIHDPDVIYEVLVRRADVFLEPQHPYRELGPYLKPGGRGILSLGSRSGGSGPESRWKLIEGETTRQCEAILADAAQAGGVLNLYPHLARLTIRIVGRALFGFAMDAYEGELLRAAMAHEDCLARVRRAPTHERDAAALRREAETHWQDLKEALRPLYGALVPPGRRLRPAALIRTYLNAYAGIATSLSWTALLLARHPRTREQLIEAPGEQVEMVIRESLRLYPPAWMMTREPVEDQVVSGWRFDRGVQAHICMYSLQRDPRQWAEAERFRPERFQWDRNGGASPYAYLPFGAGPHRCAAMPFAMTAMKCILTTMAGALRFADAGEPVHPVPRVALRPEPGAFVRVEEIG